MPASVGNPSASKTACTKPQKKNTQDGAYSMGGDTEKQCQLPGPYDLIHKGAGTRQEKQTQH